LAQANAAWLAGLVGSLHRQVFHSQFAGGGGAVIAIFGALSFTSKNTDDTSAKWVMHDLRRCSTVTSKGFHFRFTIKSAPAI